MGAREVLSQEEIDALLHGVDSGKVDTGAAALELWDACGDRIEVLVSDIVMPKMNGWELARRLTRERPDLGVLLTSGYAAEAGPDLGALERGEVCFLPKPFSLEDLLRLVGELAPRRQSPTE